MKPLIVVQIYSVLLLFSLSSMVFAEKPGRGLAPVQGNQIAKDFSLLDIAGKAHGLSDYRGRVLIVNFWATWCPPCREEMPSMQRAWEQLRDDNVVILGINVGEDKEAILRFTAEYPVTFPLLMDQDSRVSNEWSVLGLPSTFAIDPSGKIVYRALGSREWDNPDLLNAIRTLNY
jgi:peroxiredoxin